MKAKSKMEMTAPCFRKHGAGEGSMVVVTINGNTVLAFEWDGSGWRPDRKIPEHLKHAHEHIEQSWPGG